MMRDPLVASPDRLVRWTEVFENIETDAFDEFALLAGEVSRAPIALVTLVDENRHWFTSVMGAHLTEGPWEQTFCAHAVQQTGVFVVPDATLDGRFAHSPLVRDPPRLRFYAGAPLIADERVIGTLCVMDVRPRQWPRESEAGLRTLARQVVTQLELRRQTRQLSRVNAALAAEVIERQRTTDRLRHSEHALRQSQHDLQCRDAERRELVANISHDLRTPVTALQGYLETLLMPGATLDAAKQRQYILQAATLSKRLARLVSDLFELAQLDGHAVDMRCEAFVALAELTRDVAQSFALVAEAKNIAVNVRADERPAMVLGDLRLIERVLGNLLDNAIRFTPLGGTVTIVCERVGERMVVRVDDTGPGIATTDQQRVFDRFFRGRQPIGDRSTGSGLGLSIASRIIELHQGTITAATAAHGGAEFSFSLAVTDQTSP